VNLDSRFGFLIDRNYAETLDIGATT